MTNNSLSKEDLAAIQSVFDIVPRYLQARDFRSWAAQFAEDAVLMPPNSPRIKGRAAIQAYGDSLPEIREISFYDVGAEGLGDLAVGWSAISQTLVLEGGNEIKDTAKQLVVLRKQADGKWLVTAVMYNSDLPVG
jgi:uncharacterized protein (TIGR02246 family)